MYFLTYLHLNNVILTHFTTLRLITRSDCKTIETLNLREPNEAIKHFLDLLYAMYPHSIQKIAEVLNEHLQDAMAHELRRLIKDVLDDIGATLDDFMELQHGESCVPPFQSQVIS
jgi:hypothetical protein